MDNKTHAKYTRLALLFGAVAMSFFVYAYEANKVSKQAGKHAAQLLNRATALEAHRVDIAKAAVQTMDDDSEEESTE